MITLTIEHKFPRKTDFVNLDNIGTESYLNIIRNDDFESFNVIFEDMIIAADKHNVANNAFVVNMATFSARAFKVQDEDWSLFINMVAYALGPDCGEANSDYEQFEQFLRDYELTGNLRFIP